MTVRGLPTCAVFDQQHVVLAGETVLLQPRGGAMRVLVAESGRR
jgi:hypothetical protein